MSRTRTRDTAESSRHTGMEYRRPAAKDAVLQAVPSVPGKAPIRRERVRTAEAWTLRKEQSFPTGTAVRRPLRFITTALFIALSLQPAFADPADATRFDIPAQPLNRALLAFGKQSGRQLLYRTDIADNLKSYELKGFHTPEEALRILLGDAPLEAVTTGNGVITLKAGKKPHDVDGRAPVDPVTLGKITVTGQAGYDANDPYSKDYAVPNASTATKTDTPIIETPASVQVVSRAVMDDQQVIRLQDVTRDVSGVQRDFRYGNLYESFTIRGFSSASNFYRNGVRMITQSSETAHLDRVEVLKGPAAMLFGRIQPGGLLNVVTKKPLDQAYYSLQQQFGSYVSTGPPWTPPAPSPATSLCSTGSTWPI
jgi:iron complex outermembrane receptor protein